MSDGTQQLRSEAERLAAASIARGGHLPGLNDQAVVETVVRQYFRTLPAAGTRHVIDVGAAFAGIAEVFLKDGWSADLLEPNPSWQQALQRVRTTHGPRVRLFSVAGAAENRDGVPFHVNATPGLAGLAPSPLGGTSGTVAVRTVRLDSFIAENKIPAVDFLKIDTEGNDFIVLESFDFDGMSPAAIYVEYAYFFPGQNETALRAEIAKMRARGYDAVVFEYDDDGNFKRGNWKHRLVAIHADRERAPVRPNAFGNVLFYRSDDAHMLETLIWVIHFLS
jgi:FkbM family methyltransferase